MMHLIHTAKGRLLLFIIFLAVHSGTVLAWWDKGHMLVSLIAQRYMTEAALSKTNNLITMLAQEFPESADFVTASCWADDIKSKGLPYFTPWHAANLPYDPTGFLTDAQKREIVAQTDYSRMDRVLSECITSLRDPAALDWSKSITLRLVMHLVADIHQPLHVVIFYSKDFPAGDVWGHDFEVFIKTHESSQEWSLHKLWDGLIETNAQRFKRPLNPEDLQVLKFEAEKLVCKYTDFIATLEDTCLSSPAEWLHESYADAIKYAYSDLTLGKTLSQEYLTEARACVERRLVLAGYRLGKLLSDIFS